MPHMEIALAKDFSLEKIVKYRPFFFFFDAVPERSVLLQGMPLEMKFRQDGQKLIVELPREIEPKYRDFLEKRLAYCLGAGEDLSGFYAMCEHDEVLSKFLPSIEGNRLISAFDDFEAVVSIICSQNVGFDQYKEMVKRVIKTYGYKKCFPIPRDIMQRKGAISDCGVGYRDAFILEATNKMFFKSTLSDDDLNNMHGIGPYSRDIFRLFQRRDYSAFYVDTLIKKIFREQYGANLESDADIRAFAQRKFGEYSGLAEIYLQKFLNDTNQQK